MDDMANGAPTEATKTLTASAAATGAKRDFFGRVLHASDDECATGGKKSKMNIVEEERKEREARVWVSFHEGFSNAVRKPVTLREIMAGL